MGTGIKLDAQTIANAHKEGRSPEWGVQGGGGHRPLVEAAEPRDLERRTVERPGVRGRSQDTQILVQDSRRSRELLKQCLPRLSWARGSEGMRHSDRISARTGG